MQSEAGFERARAALASLESSLRARSPNDAQQIRRAEFWAQNLSSLHELLRFVRTLDPEDTASVREAAPIRERAMAENLLWLVERHFADRKIIVWGATSHVSRNREAIESGRSASMVPMGQEIWDALGERSYVVGFTSLEGLRGLPKKGDDGRPRDIGVAPENSLEDLLARAGYEVGFIDLRRLDPTSVLASPIKARPLGHAPMEAKWSRVLDGLFFIRRMTPSTIAEKTR
jgi:erythromycin esterase-like protein